LRQSVFLAGHLKQSSFFRKRDGDGHIQEDLKGVASNFESEPYKLTAAQASKPSKWLKLSVIAATSTLVGGLAVAWWYRKTLKTLRQTGEMNQNPQFGRLSDNPRDEG
jgi:hypothetical protein